MYNSAFVIWWVALPHVSDDDPLHRKSACYGHILRRQYRCETVNYSKSFLRPFHHHPTARPPRDRMYTKHFEHFKPVVSFRQMRSAFAASEIDMSADILSCTRGETDPRVWYFFSCFFFFQLSRNNTGTPHNNIHRVTL